MESRFYAYAAASSAVQRSECTMHDSGSWQDRPMMYFCAFKFKTNSAVLSLRRDSYPMLIPIR